MDRQIEIILSGRKTISVEIRRDLRIIVRAPHNMRRADIEKFISERSAWIEKHLNIMRERAEAAQAEQVEPFTEQQLIRLADRAAEMIVPRVDEFASIIGVSYGRATIKNQLSRWGSCSAKGNLNFNCLLVLCPPEVLDYVIIHELCHRRHMNHSADFWAEVEKYCPDYRSSRAWLRENGGSLLASLRLYREREFQKNGTE